MAALAAAGRFITFQQAKWERELTSSRLTSCTELGVGNHGALAVWAAQILPMYLRFCLQETNPGGMSARERARARETKREREKERATTNL